MTYIVRWKETRKPVTGLIFQKRSSAVACVKRLGTKGSFAITYKRIPKGVRRG